MEFISMKQTLIGFTVFLTILLLGLVLGSCAEEITAPPGGGPQPYMSFTLTNRSGTTVATTTELSRGNTYGLVITPGGGTTIPTADYTITYTPATAITGIATNTNSVDFMVNNIADKTVTVTITITHRTDSSVRQTVTLNLAPQADYMSFALTNSSGTTIYSTNELSRGNTYGLVITPTTGAPIPTTDYVVTHTPAAAIITNVVRTNSVDFTVNNTADTTLTITVTHRTDSSVSETITLNLAPQADYMSFTLTNSNGDTVATTTPLYRGSNYGLVITPTSGTTISTADYVVTYTPAAAITGIATNTNSVDFTVNNTADTSVTFTVTHRTASAVSETITLNFATIGRIFQQEIENATRVLNLAGASALTREVLEPLKLTEGATLVKRYATESGGGNYDGTSWSNAWAATNLRNGIADLCCGRANKAYLIMVAGGTYTPGPNRTDSFKMRERFAIMGGFDPAGGWERTGITIFSGDIGTVGDNSDNSDRVFNNDSDLIEGAHLHGVVITGGSINSILGNGAGMYNSSPFVTITSVVFSNNNARQGGGLYNLSSSLVINNSVFIGNSAERAGAGIFNSLASPVIKNTVFISNEVTGDGGGMINTLSSPVLKNTVFIGNKATGSGGAIHNVISSSPVIIGGVFKDNSANNGGGISSHRSSGGRPIIINTVFSGNSATSSADDILIPNDDSNARAIQIGGSVLGIGLSNPSNAIVGYDASRPINISNYSLTNGPVRFGTDATITVSGVDFTYPTITAGSSAINLGLYVRRDGSTNYFSEDNATWYTGFTSAGLDNPANPPTTATDLTATDIVGNPRNRRPDAGVYEVQ